MTEANQYRRWMVIMPVFQMPLQTKTLISPPKLEMTALAWFLCYLVTAVSSLQFKHLLPELFHSISGYLDESNYLNQWRLIQYQLNWICNDPIPRIIADCGKIQHIIESTEDHLDEQSIAEIRHLHHKHTGTAFFDLVLRNCNRLILDSIISAHAVTTLYNGIISPEHVSILLDSDYSAFTYSLRRHDLAMIFIVLRLHWDYQDYAPHQCTSYLNVMQLLLTITVEDPTMDRIDPRWRNADFFEYMHVYREFEERIDALLEVHERAGKQLEIWTKFEDLFLLNLLVNNRFDYDNLMECESRARSTDFAVFSRLVDRVGLRLRIL